MYSIKCVYVFGDLSRCVEAQKTTSFTAKNIKIKVICFIRSSVEQAIHEEYTNL